MYLLYLLSTCLKNIVFIGPASLLQNHTFKNVMTDSSSIFENANFSSFLHDLSKIKI